MSTFKIVVTLREFYDVFPNNYKTEIGRLLTIIIYYLVMKTKQTTLNRYLNLSSDSEPDVESEYHPTPQKSVLKVPDQWTRVKSLDQITHERNKVFDIEKDLEADKVIKLVRKGAVREQGSILFDPDSYKGRNEELKLD